MNTFSKNDIEIINQALETFLRLKMGQLKKIVVDELGRQEKELSKTTQELLQKAQKDLQKVLHNNEIVNVYSPCLHSSVRHTLEILKKFKNAPKGSMLDEEIEIKQEQEKILEEIFSEKNQ